MSRLGRNYLQVGIYTDIVFPDNDVRFIAINDNVDSSVQTEFDMTPIRNFCNELYARDTSKKIKSTFKLKGESGKHLTVVAPYGYKKSESDGDVWEIDEEAAKVVKYIFKLCVSGMGPSKISVVLGKEKILKPTAYWAKKAGKPLPNKPYSWGNNTVAKILERQEYTGCTVNNKTVVKNYRSKKRVRNDKENFLIFEDTQPPIIDKATFDTVQELRKHKRRPTHTGRISIFSGKVYCADCGAKLYFNTLANDERQDNYTCSNYRYNSGTCTCHYIRHVVLEKIVFKHLQNVLSYIQQFENVFVKKEIEKANAEHFAAVMKAKKDIVNLQARCDNLDELFKRLYEDMVSERISNERFDMLSADYEAEQKSIKSEIARLQELIDKGEQELYDLDLFLKNVRKYTDPETLTAEMVNELIDKIVVHAPDKSSGHRRQKVEIYYKAVGLIDMPDDDELREIYKNKKQAQSA